MSEQPPETTQAPAQPGPLERLAERITGHAGPEIKAAEATVAHVADDVKAAVQAHASAVFDVSGDLLKLLAVIDPADAAAAAAVNALIPKALGMAGTAAEVASKVLRA